MASATIRNQDWWLDFEAMIHVCNDKSYFKTYTKTKEPKKVLVGNHFTAKVLKKGFVEINFIFGQKLTLLNVFHVLEI